MHVARFTSAALFALLALASCDRIDPYDSYFGDYAHRVVITGDSALMAVAHYRIVEQPSSVHWNPEAASLLERSTSAFAAISPPDSLAPIHRQMRAGLDSLVVAMRLLHDRDAACVMTRRADCIGTTDVEAILASLREGDRRYRVARGALRTALAARRIALPELG